MIRLYHGSNQKIEVPDLQHSKPFKDFGSGFYLSPDKQQAWDMAFQKVSQTQQGKAEVTEFLFDETTMTGSHLKVLSYPDYCEEWALFVLKNRDRTAQQPSHDYDIVETFLERLKYMKGITFQYFFGTERALQQLKRL